MLDLHTVFQLLSYSGPVLLAQMEWAVKGGCVVVSVMYLLHGPHLEHVNWVLIGLLVSNDVWQFQVIL